MPNSNPQSNAQPDSNAQEDPTEQRSLALRVSASIVANAFPVVMIVLIVAYALGLSGDQLSASDVSAGLLAISILSFSALCGLSSMAAIEIVKRLFLLRGLYQWRQVRYWLQEREPASGVGKKAFSELLRSAGFDAATDATDRWEKWRRMQMVAQFFDLSIEQVAAQVGQAAETAVQQHQGRTSALVRCLISNAPPDGHDGSSGNGSERPPDHEVVTMINAGVDALQISIGERWQRYVRATAVYTSGLIGAVLALSFDVVPVPPRTAVLSSVILGGVIAWAGRDLAAALEQFRQP